MTATAESSSSPITRPPPVLEAPRLRLRLLDPEADARLVQLYCGEKEIADMASRIPHPYPDGFAENYISETLQRYRDNMGAIFAVTSKENGQLIGGVLLERSESCDDLAHVGYWIAKPFWGHGFCTEAVAAVIQYAFMEDKSFHCLYAVMYTHNPASQRVLEKLGFHYEGVLRSRAKKAGKHLDLKSFSLLEEEYTMKNIDKE